MPGSLVFVEHKSELDLLENLIRPDTIVISMQPSVSAELARRGISYQNTLSFFGVEGHRQTLQKSTQIVEELRPLLKEIQAEEIQQAFEKTWIFHFRFHLHYWLTMLYIVNKAVQTYNPDLLIIIQTKPASMLEVKMSEGNYLLSTIIEYYALAHKIKIQYTENSENNNASSRVCKPLKHWLKGFIFECQLRMFSIISYGKASLLAPEDTYNMPRFLSEVSKNTKQAFPVFLLIHRATLKIRLREMIKGETFSFFYVPTRVSPDKSTIFQDNLNACVLQIKDWLNDSHDLLAIYDVNLSIPLLRFIDNNLNHKMLDLYGEIISLQRVLDIVQPKQVFAQHSLGISYALGEICLRKHIPALLISHGSHVPHTGELAEFEWSVHAHTIFNSKYPFVALQTPWASKFLKEQDGVVSQGIETGPLLFARKQENKSNKLKLRKKIFGSHSNKRIILHAGTPKGWKSFRPWVYETTDEYVNNINDVIKAIDSIPNLYLAIRFRPQEGITLKDLRMSLINSNCCGIYIDGVFEDYLLSSDLLLSYSSTAIEEALQNHVPVLQYDPDGKYEHISGQVLSATRKNNISAIYSVLSKGDLIPALQWWSKNYSENNSMMVSWSEHILDFDNKMEWLSHMESKKC